MSRTTRPDNSKSCPVSGSKHTGQATGQPKTEAPGEAQSGPGNPPFRGVPVLDAPRPSFKSTVLEILTSGNRLAAAGIDVERLLAYAKIAEFLGPAHFKDRAELSAECLKVAGQCRVGILTGFELEAKVKEILGDGAVTHG